MSRVSRVRSVLCRDITTAMQASFPWLRRYPTHGSALLPQGWENAYFRDYELKIEELRADGHPKSLTPDGEKWPSRMWGGSASAYHSSLLLDEAAIRVQSVEKRIVKGSKTLGQMLVVTELFQYFHEDDDETPAIEERRKIIYYDEKNKHSTLSAPMQPTGYPRMFDTTFNHHQLFRYSALTWNAHPIHLRGDSVLVHGPLLGLLAHTAIQELVEYLPRFAYRVVAPLELKRDQASVEVTVHAATGKDGVANAEIVHNGVVIAVATSQDQSQSALGYHSESELKYPSETGL